MNLFYDVSWAEGILCIIFFGILTAIAIFELYDIKIPKYLNAVIFILGIISIFFIRDISIKDRLIGMLAISVPLLIVTMVTKRGVGGETIKLMAAAGVFMGVELIIVSTVLTLLFGGIYALISFCVRNKDIRDGFKLKSCISMGMIMGCMIGNQMWNMIF